MSAYCNETGEMEEFQVFLNENMPKIRIKIGTIQWHLAGTMGTFPIEYLR